MKLSKVALGSIIKHPVHGYGQLLAHGTTPGVPYLLGFVEKYGNGPFPCSHWNMAKEKMWFSKMTSFYGKQEQWFKDTPYGWWVSDDEVELIKDPSHLSEAKPVAPEATAPETTKVSLSTIKLGSRVSGECPIIQPGAFDNAMVLIQDGLWTLIGFDDKSSKPFKGAWKSDDQYANWGNTTASWLTSMDQINKQYPIVSWVDAKTYVSIVSSPPQIHLSQVEVGKQVKIDGHVGTILAIAAIGRPLIGYADSYPVVAWKMTEDELGYNGFDKGEARRAAEKFPMGYYHRADTMVEVIDNPTLEKHVPSTIQDASLCQLGDEVETNYMGTTLTGIIIAKHKSGEVLVGQKCASPTTIQQGIVMTTHSCDLYPDTQWLVDNAHQTYPHARWVPSNQMMTIIPKETQEVIVDDKSMASNKSVKEAIRALEDYANTTTGQSKQLTTQAIKECQMGDVINIPSFGLEGVQIIGKGIEGEVLIGYATKHSHKIIVRSSLPQGFSPRKGDQYIAGNLNELAIDYPYCNWMTRNTQIEVVASSKTQVATYAYTNNTNALDPITTSEVGPDLLTLNNFSLGDMINMPKEGIEKATILAIAPNGDRLLGSQMPGTRMRDSNIKGFTPVNGDKFLSSDLKKLAQDYPYHTWIPNYKAELVSTATRLKGEPFLYSTKAKSVYDDKIPPQPEQLTFDISIESEGAIDSIPLTVSFDELSLKDTLDKLVAKVEEWEEDAAVKKAEDNDFVYLDDNQLSKLYDELMMVQNKDAIVVKREQPTFGSMIKDDAKQAVYRVAACQISKSFKAILLTLMQKQGSNASHGQRTNSKTIQALSEMLETELGTAFVSMVLGQTITHLDIEVLQGERMQKLAEELRVNSMAMVGNAAFELLMQEIGPVISKALAGIPKEEVRVEGDEEDVMEETYAMEQVV